MTILDFLQDYYTVMIKKAQRENYSLEMDYPLNLEDLILVNKGYLELEKYSILNFQLRKFNIKEWDYIPTCKVSHLHKEKDFASSFECSGRNENFILYLQELCRILNSEIEQQIEIDSLEIDEELLELQSYMHLFQTGDIDEIFDCSFSLFSYNHEWIILSYIEDHHGNFRKTYYTYNTPDYRGNQAFKNYDELYKDTPRFVQKGEINGVKCDFFWRCGPYYVKFANGGGGGIKPILQHFISLYEQIVEHYYNYDEEEEEEFKE